MATNKLIWLVRLRLQNVFERCILSPTLQVSVYKEESRPSWPSAGILTVLLYAGIQGQQRSWFFLLLSFAYVFQPTYKIDHLRFEWKLQLYISTTVQGSWLRSIADFLLLSFSYHIHYMMNNALLGNHQLLLLNTDVVLTSILPNSVSTRAGKSKSLICWKRLKGGKRRKRRKRQKRRIWFTIRLLAKKVTH